MFYSAIFEGNPSATQPVLQCVQVKPIAGQQGGPERFRVVFSDISNFVQSMLSSRTHDSVQVCIESNPEQRSIIMFMMENSGKVSLFV